MGTWYVVIAVLCVLLGLVFAVMGALLVPLMYMAVAATAVYVLLTDEGD